jgi:nitric oxide reductase large subunit
MVIVPKGRFMKKLWISFAAVLVVSFSVLGWIGTRIYQEMPPLPARIVDTNGAVIVADGDIRRGQNVWQALGGMEVGPIWGHGSYVAPDWTADWLHRESSFVLTEWSTNEYGKPYEQLSPEDQADSADVSNRYTGTTGTIARRTPSASRPSAPVRSNPALPTSRMSS